MMDRTACLLMFAGLATGCGQSAAEKAGAPIVAASLPTRIVPNSTANAVPPWDAMRCGDDEHRNARMERHPDLIDRTAEDLLAGYGAPQADDRFRAGEGLGTYRGGVASQLPGGASRNARTVVREIVWQLGGCNFIVRFREADSAWRVFDAFEASASADF